MSSKQKNKENGNGEIPWSDDADYANRFAREGARVVTHESFQNWFDLAGEQELLDSESKADDEELEDPNEIIDRIVEFAPTAPL